MGYTSEDQMTEYQDAFSLFDKKGDGKIHISQIGDILRAIGLNPRMSEIKKIQNEVDPDAVGKKITFDEFLPIYHEQKDKQPSSTIEAFNEAFKIFDLDSNGLISGGEIRHLLTMLGERLTNDEVDALLQGLEDSSGKVRYEDLVKNVMSG